MGSTVVILDRLMDQAGTSESKEHLLEQASYAVDNVQARLLKNFEALVEEISGDLGAPEFNASTADGENKNPMPSWVMGGAKAADTTRKVLRMSYWKRDAGISYVLLRMEVDSKDRPKYYDLVLGARRRTKSEPIKMDKLRQADTSLVGWIKRMFAGSKAQ